MIPDLARAIEEPVEDPAWLVKGMLPRGSFAILAGEAGSGKSLLCYNLAMSVVNELDFLRGYPTKGTKVLYIDEENSWPDAKRYWQWTWRGLGCPPPERLEAIRFCSFHLGQRWDAEMRKQAQEFRPGLVIIDTATPALRVEDENDNAEAARKINALRQVQQFADNATTMLVIKHAKTIEEPHFTRTVRGAKTWLGAVDIVMFHTFSPGQPAKTGLRTTYLRADKPRAFGLDHGIKIVPGWTAPVEPRGLILSGSRT